MADKKTVFIAFAGERKDNAVLLDMATQGQPTAQNMFLSHESGSELRYAVLSPPAPDFIVSTRWYIPGARTIAFWNDGKGTIIDL